MLLNIWRKFKGWSVLEFFLASDARIHVKGLARKLKISPGTAQYYLKVYEKNGVLSEERMGNMLLYKLNNNFITLELKRAYALLQLGRYFFDFIEDNEGITSLALYGSYAEGSYDRSSDVDVLIISQNKKLNINRLKAIESEIKREVKTEVFSIGEWRSMANKHDNFYSSVIKNNLLLYGAKL